MKIIFWISVIIILYPYFVYPILLGIISLLKSRSILKGNIQPKISIVIPAYNEEMFINDRLKNIINLEYPYEKMEVIIVSDGSTDTTNTRVTHFIDEHPKMNIMLDHDPVRVGKTAAICRGVSHASGEVFIFSDANTEFDSLAVKNIVKCFNDKNIGAVSGQVRVVKTSRLATSKGEGFYWRFEDFIKKKESQVHSVIGADGSLYAIRKTLFEPPETGVAYSDDFIISMQVIPKGYRLVYEPEAVAIEESSKDFVSEFKRKIRSTSGGLHGYQKLWKQGMLNPFKSPIWWQLISHRMIRFAVPWAMMVALLSNFCLHGSFYRLTLAGQLGFYLLAIGGLVLPEAIRQKNIFYIPSYFSMMHIIFIPSLLRFLFGSTETKWEKIGR